MEDFDRSWWDMFSSLLLDAVQAIINFLSWAN